MKLQKLTSLGIISFIGLSIGGSQVFAAGPEPKTTEGNVTFNAGDLSLQNVGNSITFGDTDGVNITTTAQTIKASTDMALSVSDLTGSNAGWHLTAQATDFTKTGDADTKLQGTKITLPVITAKTDDDSQATAPGNAGAMPAAVEITPGGDKVNVLSAAENTGQGLWTLSWPKASAPIQLYVPTALAGTFTSTITWTVVTGPTA